MPYKRTTIGSLMLNRAVPNYIRPMLSTLKDADKGKINKFFQNVADKHPNDYRDVLYNLKVLGNNLSTIEGSSFGLQDFTPSVDKKKFLGPIVRKARAYKANGQEGKAVSLLMDASKAMQKATLDNAVARGDVMAKMVRTGARGGPAQLNMMIGAPLLYINNKGEPVTEPVVNSYAEGLQPHEYWTASYGARRGVLAEKLSIRDSGYMSKQLSRAASPLIITAKDCDTENGILEDASDVDNIGRLLARKEGPYKKNTLITADVMNGLKRTRKKKVLVRSPLTCSMHKGLCKHCVGITEKYQLPELGDNVGINAAASLSEPMSQLTLRVKHTGGVYGGGKGVEDFKLIDKLISIPKAFTHGAVLSEETGKVSDIKAAPQGGNFIYVGEHKHYSPSDVNIISKVGDKVDSGDMLTDGIINPADITRLKGIGEGRKYLAKKLQEVMRENVGNIWKANFEIVARSLVNHAQIQDPDGLGDSLPDDIVEYPVIKDGYKDKFKNKRAVPLNTTLNKYLAEDKLHYTLNTKITKKVINSLKEAGFNNIKVVDDPLPFSPIMLRSIEVPQKKADWIARLGASGLKKSLLKSLTRADVSSYHGVYPEPALAHGVNFGKPPVGKIGY